ncbi:FkbM family methyltransferase [Gymnodinialimonas ceratoperidinii]|uniref:FkbM family methyltransferase n=1 Tax=Gymnodinialimonas ceratoperidinii TaxID=2856823 RepID=A0A8F6Y8Z5_9RHOB|nr:FkbM family methyltransferase [Gymnodinialimonas ceratoperidinii]QXT38409.1 FkbM family methyltransferase [Gymnodinialimonas ceratoperidinii]
MIETRVQNGMTQVERLISDGTMPRGLSVGSADFDVADLRLTEAEVDGREVSFVTNMERDPIQRAHRNGHFYEPDELGFIRQHLPPGGTFLDIGANVGNHSLYAGLFCGAGRIIPFEPNPLAYRLLVLNLVMNGLQERTVFDYVGFGASDVDGEGFTMTERHKNLGAARMVPGDGEIATLRPDDFLRDETPDFIKIDVEGMEMAVLRGLQKTIRRTRPVLLVEVDRDNIHDFADWRLANGFDLPASIKHYKDNRNFLCVPEERSAELSRKVGQG